MTTILVAYASKHYATAEIAEVIGRVLRLPCTFPVDVRPVGEVLTLSPYDAVVLGSAVYMGKWKTEAEDFLKKYESDLMRRPTWLFSSGPTGAGDPVAQMNGWKFPEDLQPIADSIKPRDIALFHGKLDTAHLNILERGAIALVKAPVGDFRDWHAIEAWAEGIAHALAEHTPA